MAGGGTGKAFIYDGRTGRELAAPQLGDAAATFIRDVTIHGGRAYFTDLLHPIVYSVRRNGSAVGAIDVDGTPPPDGLNGIVATRHGGYLLATAASPDALWRIDRFTGEATQVDLGFEPTFTRGLLVRHRLYAVDPLQQSIAVVGLAPSYDRGRLLRRLTGDLNLPTDIARIGKNLFTLNSASSHEQGDRFRIARVPDER